MTTLDLELDGERLATLQTRVEQLMADGRARTLRQIADCTKGSEASVSARLRDARKRGVMVCKARIGNEKKGLWKYWFGVQTPLYRTAPGILETMATAVMAKIVGWGDPT